ncbi:MAG TPA: TVP38/TMEM64 family protein, partial [Stenomitos sp.]
WAQAATLVAVDLNPQPLMQQALDWVAAQGAASVVAFIGLYILATIVFLPASLLTLGAGVLFGVIAGSIYVWIGATLGSIAAFLIGRYLGRNWIAHRIADNDTLGAIDAAVGQEGLKIVLLTRLSPIFPFNVLNYAYSVTSISLKDYILGSIGMIPGTVMYVYIGALAGNLTSLGTAARSPHPTLDWILRIGGFIATVAVALLATRIANQVLEHKIATHRSNDDVTSRR